jgi:hypothetical protein
MSNAVSAEYNLALGRLPIAQKRNYDPKGFKWLEAQLAKDIPLDECLLWPFDKNRNGYGVAGCWPAHRIAYEIHYRADTGELKVFHSCKNKACVNPHHLHTGSSRPLIEEEALFIREEHFKGRTIESLAEYFDVPKKYINDIVTRRTWSWLPARPGVDSH